MSALHYAVQNEDEKLVNLLVMNFADIRCQNSDLQCPMHLACTKGNLAIYKALVDKCFQATECLDI